MNCWFVDSRFVDSQLLNLVDCRQWTLLFDTNPIIHTAHVLVVFNLEFHWLHFVKMHYVLFARCVGVTAKACVIEVLCCMAHLNVPNDSQWIVNNLFIVTTLCDFHGTLYIAIQVAQIYSICSKAIKKIGLSQKPARIGLVWSARWPLKIKINCFLLLLLLIVNSQFCLKKDNKNICIPQTEPIF